MAYQEVAEVKVDSSDPHDNIRPLQEIVTIGWERELNQKGEFTVWKLEHSKSQTVKQV